MNLMTFIILILFLIAFISIINEKFFHMQNDIALLFFSLIISLILISAGLISDSEFLKEKIRNIGNFGFESYLMDFVLCFMLFAGASKVNMKKFRQNIKAISLLALLATIVSSAVYGFLFRLSAFLIGINMDIWTCILLGCIVSPTDPIAATGILNKLGLSKNVTSVIENESLFNDGTGVALFVFVKSIVSQNGESNFILLMLKEVLGAFGVAIVVSFILFRLLTLSGNPLNHLLISFIDVSLVYMICEHSGFSGVIASVVCGMYFSAKMDSIKRRRIVEDPHNLYIIFWEVADNIFNSVLFVMIGISVLDFTPAKKFLLLIPSGILCVILSRFAGTGISALLVGKKRIPSSYSTAEFVTLMTWSALKGGLSLALAMSTAEFLAEETYFTVMNVTYITIFFTVIVQGLTIKSGYSMIEKHKARRIRAESENAR